MLNLIMFFCKFILEKIIINLSGLIDLKVCVGGLTLCWVQMTWQPPTNECDFVSD